ncbi:hypothetical protein BLNAU_10963 [Blattamonas nauphoetae]|uniref:Uncharacterized protein n=1 Tax=Blattamonas nauphoetae TaxID=2049346 RepID=A0ABQ9XSV0_9EUKA|nr:hypothetical protein BLNAU_10963 [Blattamonas nauphoetae]
MASLLSNVSPSRDDTCTACYPFLNWDEYNNKHQHENAIIFRSLVATVKLQPALDDSLEAKAVNFLNTVDPNEGESADAFLGSFASLSHEPSTEFVQSMIVLVSSASEVITTTTMKVLKNLIWFISAKLNLTLVKADLIPQLILTLNPLSLSFAEAEDIHTSLISTITWSAWLSTPDGLRQLEIEDQNEQQVVHKTVFQQVVAPSAKYISHLCVNRNSIIDGDQSKFFLELLSHLLRISSYYQPTMDCVFRIPVFLTIPSCLTFFEHDKTIWYFLYRMNNTQLYWNKTRGKVRQMWKTVHRVLRMEGIEDVIAQKLQNDGNGDWGQNIVVQSIEWKGLLGMNLPGRR